MYYYILVPKGSGTGVFIFKTPAIFYARRRIVKTRADTRAVVMSSHLSVEYAAKKLLFRGPLQIALRATVCLNHTDFCLPWGWKTPFFYNRVSFESLGGERVQIMQRTGSYRYAEYLHSETAYFAKDYQYCEIGPNRA
jgi:hypothetical protein